SPIACPHLFVSQTLKPETPSPVVKSFVVVAGLVVDDRPLNLNRRRYIYRLSRHRSRLNAEKVHKRFSRVPFTYETMHDAGVIRGQRVFNKTTKQPERIFCFACDYHIELSREKLTPGLLLQTKHSKAIFNEIDAAKIQKTYIFVILVKNFAEGNENLLYKRQHEIINSIMHMHTLDFLESLFNLDDELL
uniref:Uncharacterized protein n=1 Tax=Romanomermis culicivorax TaxID=13658 RepID=A0A915IQ40_ROMCU